MAFRIWEYESILRVPNTNVCLIVISFADCQEIAKLYNSLSGNKEIDTICSFSQNYSMRSHLKLKKISVDLLPVSNIVRTHNIEDILLDRNFMERFDCRNTSVKLDRSILKFILNEYQNIME